MTFTISHESHKRADSPQRIVADSHGFATLVPAFTLRAQIDKPIPSKPSDLHPGGLALVTVPKGTLKSEPGFHIKVDAHALNSVDIARRDSPKSKYLRLNARAFFEDAATDVTFGCFITGTVEIDKDTEKILAGKDVKTTEFGKVVTQFKFAAGGKLEKLEQECWVGSARFVAEGKDQWIEYKISQVKGGPSAEDAKKLVLVPDLASFKEGQSGNGEGKGEGKREGKGEPKIQAPMIRSNDHEGRGSSGDSQ